MSTVSGGMPQAAAAAAAAAAAGVQQSRLSENFYRFQQREQRRTGEQGPPCSLVLLTLQGHVRAAAVYVACNLPLSGAGKP
jgi:hypothetical protein